MSSQMELPSRTGDASNSYLYPCNFWGGTKGIELCLTFRLRVPSITLWLPSKIFIIWNIVVIPQHMHNTCVMTNG